MPTALGAQSNRRSPARGRPARPRWRASGGARPSPPLLTLLPSPLGFQLLYSCPEGARTESPFFLLLVTSIPTVSFAFPTDLPQPFSGSLPQNQPGGNFSPPPLRVRATLLRLRQLLPQEGAPVRQHPGPFTLSPPHPLPSAWPAPPSVLLGGNCPPGPSAGLDYESGSTARAL